MTAGGTVSTKSDSRFRSAVPADATAIAGLHADSWRRHYRGAYADAFLDGDVASYLERIWTERLAAPAGQTRTVVVESGGELIGLGHTVLDADPTWGALLDNLHVVHTRKREGIGSRLLAYAAEAALESSAPAGLFLWVLEQNSAAQAFYSARGGVPVESDDVPPPGGDPARLQGKPLGVRYVWRAPAVLTRSI
jgi:GNAT superfamily N-acetyltransferase